MSKTKKVYKLNVPYGNDFYTMFGTKADVRYKWDCGQVFDILESTTSNEMYVRLAGKVFIAHDNYTQVPTAKGIEMLNAEASFQLIKSNAHVTKAN